MSIIIMGNGFVPDTLLTGLILSISKNPWYTWHNNAPENYRPITFLSCIGNFFTCILIKKKLPMMNKHSTVDTVFILHKLYFQNILQSNELIVCGFIDFPKT